MADYPRSLGSRNHCLDFGRDGFKDVGGSLVGSVTTFPPTLEGNKLIHEGIDIELIDGVFQSINQCRSERLQIVLAVDLLHITVQNVKAKLLGGAVIRAYEQLFVEGHRCCALYGNCGSATQIRDSDSVGLLDTVGNINHGTCNDRCVGNIDEALAIGYDGAGLGCCDNGNVEEVGRSVIRQGDHGCNAGGDGRVRILEYFDILDGVAGSVDDLDGCATV